MQPSKNTVVLKDGVRYVQVISRQFVCPKCWIFCYELVPIYRRGLIKRMRARGQEPTVKVYCKNGCHFHPSWSFVPFDWKSTAHINRIRDWPREWRHDDVARKIEREHRDRGDA